MDQIARPVLLVWDKPNVELRKSRNLLDQLMPLYTCPPKFYNCGSPAMHLMIGHPGSLNFMPQDVIQTTRAKKGILIEPLEPDDSDEECVSQSFLTFIELRKSYKESIREDLYSFFKEEGRHVFVRYHHLYPFV